jgi:pilus assembly protein CpaF
MALTAEALAPWPADWHSSCNFNQPMQQFLQRLQRDDSIDELIIQADGTVLEDRRGRLKKADMPQMPTQRILPALQHALLGAGTTIDPLHPRVEVMLTPSVRLSAVAPPIAPQGLTIHLRHLRRSLGRLSQLVEGGAMSSQQQRLLSRWTEERRTVVICGPTSSGKTTLLAALLSQLPATDPIERIITIEQSAELQLDHPGWLALAASDCPVSGHGVDQLLSTALRLRPDRLIVGECRGGEVVPFLQAIQSGHPGSMCTVHATDAHQALHRLALLVSLSRPAIPLATALSWIRELIDVVVVLERDCDGTRRVRELVPVKAMTTPPYLTKASR